MWTPFDCCLILIQKERNKRRKKGTKPRKVPEEKPNRRIRKTERKSSININSRKRSIKL